MYEVLNPMVKKTNTKNTGKVLTSKISIRMKANRPLRDKFDTHYHLILE